MANTTLSKVREKQQTEKVHFNPYPRQGINSSILREHFKHNRKEGSDSIL